MNPIEESIRNIIIQVVKSQLPAMVREVLLAELKFSPAKDSTSPPGAAAEKMRRTPIPKKMRRKIDGAIHSIQGPPMARRHDVRVGQIYVGKRSTTVAGRKIQVTKLGPSKLSLKILHNPGNKKAVARDIKYSHLKHTYRLDKVADSEDEPRKPQIVDMNGDVKVGQKWWGLENGRASGRLIEIHRIERDGIIPKILASRGRSRTRKIGFRSLHKLYRVESSASASN